jgi:hypothetical protein
MWICFYLIRNILIYLLGYSLFIQKSMVKAETDRKIFISEVIRVIGDANQKRFVDIFKTFTTKVNVYIIQDVS